MKTPHRHAPVVAAAIAVSIATAAATLLAGPVGAAPKPKASAASACQVSAPPAPSWLDIQATGLVPSMQYEISVATPIGSTMYDLLYAAPDGTVTDTTLPATYSGNYAVTIAKFKGGMVGGCSTTV